MTPDWYEDLAERLIEAAEHADAMGYEQSTAVFRAAAAGALDMATAGQDDLERLWQWAQDR